MSMYLGFLLCFCTAFGHKLDDNSVCGRINVKRGQGPSCPTCPVTIRLYNLAAAGSVLTKELILGSPAEVAAPDFESKVVLPKSSGSYDYCITRSAASTEPAGPFALFAFQDLNNNGKLDPATDPLGWYSKERGGPPAQVKLGQSLPPFTLVGTTSFEDKKVEGGKLVKSRGGGPNIMLLKGTASERAFAHGRLAARQIVEFFQFYLIENRLQSARMYEETVRKMLEEDFAQYHDEAYQIEAMALLNGMAMAAVDAADPSLLLVESLQRNFSAVDLMAIQAYDSLGSWCSQFVAWGSSTDDGETITARNMDGEIDIRHVTVSHLVLFAIHPFEPGTHRYLSLMWPGFLGTYSALNEKGLYTMVDAGNDRPTSQHISRRYSNTWIVRAVVQNMEPSDATPSAVAAKVGTFKSSGGGSFNPGTILVVAKPSDESAKAKQPNDSVGFVYEGDALGGQVRLPMQAPPFLEDMIMATNHFLSLGINKSEAADSRYPGALTCCSNCSCTFSSQFRYEAGMQAHVAWKRSNRLINVATAVDWLQRVAHSTTEHSIVTIPAKRKLGIMVAERNGMWDAPYSRLQWFDFSIFEQYGRLDDVTYLRVI